MNTLKVQKPAAELFWVVNEPNNIIASVYTADDKLPKLFANSPALLKALEDIYDETMVDGTDKDALCAIIRRICTIAINKATS